MLLLDARKNKVLILSAFLALTALMVAIEARVALRAAENGASKAAHATSMQAGLTEPEGDPYPLATCPVSGLPIATVSPVSVNYLGREIRFCCPNCPARFKENPGPYIEKINAAIIDQQTPFYPLDTCVVSGEKLNKFGRPVDYVYQNRLVRLSNTAYIGAFERDPEKYLMDIEVSVIEQQLKNYPLQTCVVSGLPLPDKPFEFVFAMRLVRLYSADYVTTFLKDPQKYVDKIDEALRTW